MKLAEYFVIGLLLAAAGGCFYRAFAVERQALEQLQLQDCITRPWLDTSHGC